ncbi:hypothetical protein M3Y99_01371900 [Aphelenchoides fujianensis]|nr:hypothetical protein M3Y99_01371900 [Aphelenchoides fujianensis]
MLGFKSIHVFFVLFLLGLSAFVNAKKGCLDMGKNCQVLKDHNLCDNEIYKEVIKEACPKKCGKCK